MKINFSAHNVAIASFAVIAITSWSGLAILPKTVKGNLTPYGWGLVITGSLSTIGGFWLVKEKSDDWTLEDEEPDALAEVFKNHREPRSNDSRLNTHAFLNTSFNESITKEVEKIAQQLSTIDEVLARQTRVNTEIALLNEPEQRAKNSMLAILSHLGTDSDPLEALRAAVRICSDVRLWVAPANYETRYSDTAQFYCEGKIWLTVRDSRIIWGLHPDYTPPEEELWSAETVEQTPFCPFRCCSQCKYIGEYHSACAVVPFGCMGDPSEQCWEFERKNGGTQGTELQWVDTPF